MLSLDGIYDEYLSFPMEKYSWGVNVAVRLNNGNSYSKRTQV